MALIYAYLVLITILITGTSNAHAKTVFETYGGPCEDFNYYVKNRGLKDVDGNTHVGTLGYTACRVQIDMDPHGAVRESQIEGQRCLAADLSKAKIEVDQVITIMRWDHGDKNVSTGCKAELQRTEAAIQAHEAVHVADCKMIREEAVGDWVKIPRSIKVCAGPGEAPAALVKKLQARIGEEAQGLAAKMGKEMEYRSRETHERIGYGTSGISCSKCE